MEEIIEDEEFNYDNTIGRVIMVWTNRRSTPYHGRLIKHNKYIVMIEDRYNCKLLIPKIDIFYVQLKRNQSI